MSINEFVALEHTPDITQASVSEVMRALAYPARFPHLDDFDSMRQRVGDNIVSLAFRRYLDEQKIPYQLSESLNFSQPDRFDVTFGGRRCIPFAQFICNRKIIQQVHQDPDLILSENIYLPDGAAAAYRDVDIYLFISMTCLVTRSRDDVEKAIVAGQPSFLVYQMPEAWAAPAQWENLAPLVLKTDIAEDLVIDLHGQDQQRGYLSESIDLPGRRRVEITPEFYTIGALRAGALPSGPIGLHSKTLDDTLLVAPFQWGNIWVYVLRMYITGYITQADFFRHAEKVSGVTAGRLNPCVQRENLFSAPCAELKPPQDLFIRAANWERMKKNDP